MKRAIFRSVSSLFVAAMMVSCTGVASFNQSPAKKAAYVDFKQSGIVDLQQGEQEITVNLSLKTKQSAFVIKDIGNSIKNGFNSTLDKVDYLLLRLHDGAPGIPADQFDGPYLAEYRIDSPAANNVVRFIGLLNGHNYSITARAFGTDLTIGGLGAPLPGPSGTDPTVYDGAQGLIAVDSTINVEPDLGFVPGETQFVIDPAGLNMTVTYAAQPVPGFVVVLETIAGIGPLTTKVNIAGGNITASDGAGGMGSGADVGGGTAPGLDTGGGPEYVSIDPDGNVTLNNDTNNPGVWDLAIQLMGDLASEADGNLDIIDGGDSPAGTEYAVN